MTDAVVIGAGHNGLIAAIMVAKAGWDVTVFERNDYAGGAVRTAEVTLPGFRHDVYAANLSLIMGSGFMQRHGGELLRRGFEPVQSARPYASVFPDGTFIGVSTNREQTDASIAAVCPQDLESWGELTGFFASVAPALFGVFGSAIRSRGLVEALWHERSVLRREWPELLRLLLQSPREFVEERFTDKKMQALCATWGMHLDFPPDVPGGAVFAFMETFASARNGMVLGKGGSQSLTDALVSLLLSLGGKVELSSPVRRVLVEEGRAVGVQLESGEVHRTKRAVIGNVTPRVLFSTLVPPDSLDRDFHRSVRRYRYGPGTMMIHLAVDDLPDWAAGRALREYSYVHIAPYLNDNSLCYAQAVAGMLPIHPTIVVGQPTAVDASRAPQGKHTLWIQVRVVPGKVLGDAAGEIASTDWDEVKELYADRVLGLIEGYAPSFREHIMSRMVISPADLERDNPNLVGGDHLAGSHHPFQNFLMRPFPRWSNYRTPIEALYMCGAATWPGAGVNGGSGYMLGRKLVDRFSERRLPASLRDQLRKSVGG